MKKSLFAFFLILPLAIDAQNVATLKNQADTLSKYGKEKKAGKLYKKAIERVLTYQERITDDQWMQLSVAAHTSDYAVTKKKFMPYVCWIYGNDGPKLNEKIKELAAQGVKCIFTYTEWLGMMGPPIYLFPDPTTGQNVGIKKNARTLLAWATDTDVYFQEFNSSNIYKPLAIKNDTLRDILMNHADAMIHQALKEEFWRVSEAPFFSFDFHLGKEIWHRQLYDPKYLRNPESNSKTYVAKLMPLIWQEFKLYREKAIAGI